MIFGPAPLHQAEGAVLAHSVQAGGRKLRKGLVLTSAHIADLRAAGLAEVTVARFGPDDVAEDAAATELAARICPGLRPDLRRSDAFTGRVNLLAATPGVLRVDVAAIAALNAVDPGITVATLPDNARVGEGAMLATIKIIPYAVSRAHLDAACAVLSPEALRVAAPVVRRAALVQTATDAIAGKVLAKGEAVVRARLSALGVSLTDVRTVAHETGAVARALAATDAPLVLILGASATSDAQDVCPAALTRAGGTLTRFGMPVDPGNLLFLGRLGARDVVGLPGCARSPALNGADWVIERLVCGLPVGSADIAAMGVGGLLKEIPIRPQPRAQGAPRRKPARVAVVMLAAGASRRMGGRDKLLEEIGGEALLRRSARAACASRAASVYVVLPPDPAARRAALEGLDVTVVTASDAAEGMAASLRAGLAAAGPSADAVIVALADMPEVRARTYDALIAAYDPAQGHEICRAVAEGDGAPGHPVLFGRRFFESLAGLGGDQGARAVLAEAQDYVRDVPTEGQSALRDLDTPEQWAAYRADLRAQGGVAPADEKDPRGPD